MLKPNLDCWITKKTGSFTLNGEAISGTPFKERCAIVRLRDKMVDTTVRADSSASRAHAEEFVTDNKILLMGTTKARLNDKLTIFGINMRIVSMFPRHDVTGRLDHFEIMGEVWD